jgi:pentatricopeptide repeat protein
VEYGALDAFEVFLQMIDDGVTVHLYSFNFMLRSLGREGFLDEALQVFQLLKVWFCLKCDWLLKLKKTETGAAVPIAHLTGLWLSCN